MSRRRFFSGSDLNVGRKLFDALKYDGACALSMHDDGATMEATYNPEASWESNHLSNRSNSVPRVPSFRRAVAVLREASGPVAFTLRS